ARLGAASGIVLLLCAVAALALANSSLADDYRRLVHLEIGLTLGDFRITNPAGWWINDGLMALFFFIVGLEIKREVLTGELRSPRAAALPVIAAAGGMLAPGLIYAAFNLGHPTLRGWGIPTATDIAFALGVLALLGDRVPTGLRVFLATLAIADDIGALLVIAVFYTERLQFAYLTAAGAVLGIMVCFNVAGVRRPWLYLIAGVPLWWLIYRSGVHATIAGVLAAFTIPATSRVDRQTFTLFVRSALGAIEHEKGTPLRSSPAQQAAVQGIEDACQKVQTPMQSFEHALIPWVTFLIVPLFALANAGVTVSGAIADALRARETLGVVAGLAVGKPLGITLFSLLALKTGLGRMPAGVTVRMLHAAAWIAGIGFTMSLFIANLAFPAQAQAAELDHAKIGILAGSTVSAAVGLALLAHATRPRRDAAPPVAVL
ncbi:MAG: Na+/H+ antiporter NhaA, partial [Thermoleophilia bacterium]|nr:Na+/H+ antiporter NhaA [Thermoleophilia bacterium]